MIDTIIFDMGQVLIRWTGTLMLEKYELSETDHSLLLRELFGDVEWVMLDHGTISFEEAVKAVCRRVPEHLHGYNYSPDEFGKMYNLASNSAALKVANTYMDDETYQLFEDARSSITQEQAAELVKQVQESIYVTNRYFISYMTQYECKISADFVKGAGFFTLGGYHWTPETAYIAK